MSLPRTLPWLSFLILAFVGCSFVDSSESISDSSGKSSEGISHSISSSSPEDSKSAYRNDIRDYTSAYVKSGGQIDYFWRDVGTIAEKHGISNWEADNTTYVGIGEGLAKANVNSTELSVYKQHLTGFDQKKMQDIQKGYDSIAKN